jgi:hypothetical protein
MVAVCLINLLGKSLKNLKKFSFFLFFKIDCFSFVLGNLSLIKRDQIVWIAFIVAVLIKLFWVTFLGLVL